MKSLDSPSEARRGWFGSKRKRRVGELGSQDRSLFTRFAEATARFMGTSKFLLWMTIFVVIWIVANLGLSWWMGAGNRWDPYPFILLNLMFSTQASYAAPLIMFAQNRQDDRDRVIAEQDRQQAARALADTEYLTREIAALRLAVSELATRDFVRSELRDLWDEIGQRLPDLAGKPEPDGAEAVSVED